MARKGQAPAQPAEQKPVDPAPTTESQKAGAPGIEEAAQPPVVETPPVPPADPEPVPAPEPVEHPELEPAPEPEPVAPATEELPEPLAQPELSPRAIELLAALFAPADIEPLATYAARIEEAAQPLPVCQITHPDAKNGSIHVGKYAGIRLVHGDTPAALLSDGTTI